MLFKLLKGVKQYKQNQYLKQQELLKKLQQGQHPSTLFITCADSRIVPSLLTHSEPGKLFMTRNVGALVPTDDKSSLSMDAVLEYALKGLGVKQIILCGHSHCGAMHGLQQENLEETLPNTAAWLQAVKSNITNSSVDTNSLEQITRESIKQQFNQLNAHSLVREYIQAGQLAVFAWHYYFETGEVYYYSPEEKQFNLYDPSQEHGLSFDVTLKEGLNYFQQHLYPQQQTLFKNLAHGQKPSVYFVTCSDSRVAPADFLQADPGEVFITRNIGNMVPPWREGQVSGEAAALEFALKQLEIKDIVVCGHSECGAMNGLADLQQIQHLPQVSSWLKQNTPESTTKTASIPELTRQNTLNQIANIKSYPTVQEKIAAKELNVHAWYYDFAQGEVYIYHEQQHAFLDLETSITQALSSTLMSTRIHEFVQKKVTAFVETLLRTQRLDEAKNLVTQLRLTGSVTAIWDYIGEECERELWSEYGELCDNIHDSRFVYLIAEAKKTVLNLDSVQQQLEHKARSPSATGFGLFQITPEVLAAKNECCRYSLM